MSTTDPVTVLGSGVALGVYVPALLVERRLNVGGVPASVELFEALYRPESMQRLIGLRRRMQQDFAFAQMVHRLPTDTADVLDPTAVEELLGRWQAQGRRRFIVWSGFWMEILDRYVDWLQVERSALHVDVCRIDAVASTSFRGHESWLSSAREIWFWRSHPDGQVGLEHKIVPDTDLATAFEDRADRCVVHGGGWGLGDYREVVSELVEAGVSVDAVSSPSQQPAGGARWWSTASGWEPWTRDGRGDYEFPPFGPVDEVPKRRPDHAPVIDVIVERKAIVSKPGGGTLLDSLATATPLVLLAPYGPAEAENARVWQGLGLGISYSDWRVSRFSFDCLSDLHHNLRERRGSARDYVHHYVAEWKVANAG